MRASDHGQPDDRRPQQGRQREVAARGADVGRRDAASGHPDHGGRQHRVRGERQPRRGGAAVGPQGGQPQPHGEHDAERTGEDRTGPVGEEGRAEHLHGAPADLHRVDPDRRLRGRTVVGGEVPADGDGRHPRQHQRGRRPGRPQDEGDDEQRGPHHQPRAVAERGEHGEGCGGQQPEPGPVPQQNRDQQRADHERVGEQPRRPAHRPREVVGTLGREQQRRQGHERGGEQPPADRRGSGQQAAQHEQLRDGDPDDEQAQRGVEARGQPVVEPVGDARHREDVALVVREQVARRQRAVGVDDAWRDGPVVEPLQLRAVPDEHQRRRDGHERQELQRGGQVDLRPTAAPGRRHIVGRRHLGGVRRLDDGGHRGRRRSAVASG